MKLRKDQQGFTAVEILLTLIFVAIVVFIGYYVAHAQKDKTTKASSQATTATTSKTDANANTMKIPELGVQFTVPNTLTDLSYTVDTSDGQTTATFNEGGSLYSTFAEDCPSDGLITGKKVTIGSVTKVDGQYPTNPGAFDGGLLKQFTGYYLTIGAPNGNICDSNSDGSPMPGADAWSKALNNFETAFKSTGTEITQ